MLAAIFSSVDAFYFFSFASRGAHFRAAYFTVQLTVSLFLLPLFTIENIPNKKCKTILLASISRSINRPAYSYCGKLTSRYGCC